LCEVISHLDSGHESCCDKRGLRLSMVMVMVMGKIEKQTSIV